MSTLTNNLRRAKRIGQILTRWRDWGSQQEVLIDLLTDVMHWCDVHGEEFHIVLSHARRHYIHELNDQQTDERRMQA